MVNKIAVFLGFTFLSLSFQIQSFWWIFRKKTDIVIEKGDITDCQVDAIVNAANDRLDGGLGVCRAIFLAAGWQDMQDACDAAPVVKGDIRCPVGQARITASYNLAKTKGIKKVIHTVGPDCRVITDKDQQNTFLKDAYKNALILADQNNIKTIAFPFISSAIYAFPKERAARIALQTVQKYVQQRRSNITEIHFVLFSQDDTDLFNKTKEELDQADQYKIIIYLKNLLGLKK